MSQTTERMITELWAWVVCDHMGNEGVLRRSTEIGTQPMIADSREALEQFAGEARIVAAEMKMNLSVAHFERVYDADQT